MALIRCVAEYAGHPEFRGCAFLNAATEFPEEGHPARLAALKHKEELRRRVRGLTRALGVRSPATLADQLILLIRRRLRQRPAFWPPGACERRNVGRSGIDRRQPRKCLVTGSQKAVAWSRLSNVGEASVPMPAVGEGSRILPRSQADIKTNDELKQIAGGKNMTIPDSPDAAHQAAKAKLQAKSGAASDESDDDSDCALSDAGTR